MALYALENVDDAFGVTREFLASIGRKTWLKLAVVVFFVGGAGANFPGFSFGGDGGTDPSTPPTDEIPGFDFGPDFWVVVAVVVAAVVLVAVAFMVVSAVMEFVFVESLRTGVVSVREYWSRYWRKGLRLFAFRFLVGLLSLAAFAVVAAMFFLPVLFDAVAFSILLLVVVGLPVFIVFAIFVGLVDGFTTAFVVPIMLLEDRGVVSGWRRLWSTVRSQWKQYLVYAVAAFVLSIAGGIFVFVVAAVLGVLLLIPLGVLGAIGFALLSVAEPVGIAVLAVTAVLGVLAFFLVVALASVPVQTYLRYYALLVLGDVDGTLDLIPDRRAAVRTDDEATDDAGLDDGTLDGEDGDDDFGEDL